MEDAQALQSSPLIRDLASSNSHIRSEALENLRQFLRARKDFTSLDFLKIWKGLFYCMWMSDRPKAQQELARQLAGLVDVFRDENVALWVGAFWTTMAREWGGIDGLRMDKFLYLVRQYLYATFRYLSKHSWSDKRAIGVHMSILSATPLNPTDDRIPNGLRYHVLDVYVDELDHVDPDRTDNMPLETLLEPVKELQKESPAKVTRKKAEEVLGDERLEGWRRGGAVEAAAKTKQRSHSSQAQLSGASAIKTGMKDEDEDEWGGIDED